MVNSYFFTLFLFVVLQIHTVSLQVFDQLAIANLATMYHVVIYCIIFLLMYGFTHVVKANTHAPTYNYVCALFTFISAITVLTVLFTTTINNIFVLITAVACILSAINLTHQTKKNTRSYFM